ncbi:hypothetical protein ANCCAN_29080 [Ancylostoma caninum]|uniref:Uncharacterized protein n=1 Tax=Ancylostoma caninum TaxID=29170 RepID=A0A368F2G6_ANCCA|nr:hypothetical protein ANCCAN_29080 [Ancylostoma caninum]
MLPAPPEEIIHTVFRHPGLMSMAVIANIR